MHHIAVYMFMETQLGNCRIDMPPVSPVEALTGAICSWVTLPAFLSSRLLPEDLPQSMCVHASWEQHTVTSDSM